LATQWARERARVTGWAGEQSSGGDTRCDTTVEATPHGENGPNNSSVCSETPSRTNTMAWFSSPENQPIQAPMGLSSAQLPSATTDPSGRQSAAARRANRWRRSRRTADYARASTIGAAAVSRFELGSLAGSCRRADLDRPPGPIDRRHGQAGRRLPILRLAHAVTATRNGFSMDYPARSSSSWSNDSGIPS
jgi:hypothetical protein